LLLDFGKPRYAAAVARMNLKPGIDKLNNAQKRFEQVFIERSKVDSGHSLSPVYFLVNPIRNILVELLKSLNTFERRSGG
jgi:hypothetical protein